MPKEINTSESKISPNILIDLFILVMLVIDERQFHWIFYRDMFLYNGFRHRASM
jgi:hypothetical protein